jgi:hypothetical protein
MAILDVRLIRQETDLAFQVILQCRRRFWWLPKRQIQNHEQFQTGQENVTMIVPDWLVDEKEEEWQNAGD